MPEWTNPKLKGEEGRPALYIAMGQTDENVADSTNVQRRDGDHYAQRSQEAGPSKSQGVRLLRQRDRPGRFNGTSVAKDEGPQRKIQPTRSSPR